MGKKRVANDLEVLGKYKLVADDMNVTLQEKMHNTKQGFDYWANIAYFSNPRAALKYVVDKEVMENWADDLKVLVATTDKLREMIDGITGDVPL